MARLHSPVKGLKVTRGIRCKLLLVGALSLAFAVATVIACMPAMDRNARGVQSPKSRGIVLSQTPIGADIQLINYTAPSFTWLGPVRFTFTLYSNVSVNESLYVSIASADSIQSLVELHSLSIGLNIIEMETSVLVTALPGDKTVNITLSRGGDTLNFTHVMWVGSGLVLTMVFLAGSLIIAVAIIVKYGSSNAPSSTAMTSGLSAGTIDDDTSTVTYVDQSRAPPGRIFCPECKKVIEEGSIFCPECGTRIPRYLRYKP